jgi:TPR repeat protein
MLKDGMPLYRNSLLLGIAGIALAVGATWALRSGHPQSTTRIDKISPEVPAGVNLPSNGNSGEPIQQVNATSFIDPLAERKKSKDYHQLVELLLPLAKKGSAPAQYEIASVLHYCDVNVHAHFVSHTGGAIKTQNDMRATLEKLDDNARKQYTESYQRCSGFLGDQSALNDSTRWLEEAAQAGYAPAKFMQADLMLQASLVARNSDQIDQARKLAIDAASSSADPDIVFGMADFVTGAGKTQDQTTRLMSAWWLAGCERGTDCSPQSEWILANCLDAQCANQPTVVEELQRMNGANFGEVEQLAEGISNALNSHDPEALKKYL